MSDALQLLLLVLSYPAFRACRYLVERSDDIVSQPSTVDGAPPPVATEMNRALWDFEDNLAANHRLMCRSPKWPKKKTRKCRSKRKSQCP